MTTEEIVVEINREIERLITARDILDGLAEPIPEPTVVKHVKWRKTPKFSPEGLARIAAAQRKRWAKFNQQKAGK